MTDIIERLREAGQYGSDNDGELMRHAADEIERLRKEIAAERERCAQVAEHLNGWGHPRAPELAAHIAKVIRRDD